MTFQLASAIYKAVSSTGTRIQILKEGNNYIKLYTDNGCWPPLFLLWEAGPYTLTCRSIRTTNEKAYWTVPGYDKRENQDTIDKTYQINDFLLSLLKKMFE